MTKQAVPISDARSIHHQEAASPPQPSPLAAIAKQLPAGWLDRQQMWTTLDEITKPDGPDQQGRAVSDRAASITLTTSLYQAGHIEISRGSDGEEIYRRVAK